jgi:hypothetical protein
VERVQVGIAAQGKMARFNRPAGHRDFSNPASVTRCRVLSSQVAGNPAIPLPATAICISVFRHAAPLPIYNPRRDPVVAAFT